MNLAYLIVTIVLAAMAAFSGLGKLRRDPKIVHVVSEVVGVPFINTGYLGIWSHDATPLLAVTIKPPERVVTVPICSRLAILYREASELKQL